MVVGQARTGVQAIALARKHSPDVILMDLREFAVPVCAAAIEKDKRGPSLRVACRRKDKWLQSGRPGQ
jgi:DNA-binding NarL/FixJ family response regulator